MASKTSMFVLLWTFSASYADVKSRRGQHPLCRALDNREHQLPAHFPVRYVCHGDGDDVICTLQDTETVRTSASKVSAYIFRLIVFPKMNHSSNSINVTVGIQLHAPISAYVSRLNGSFFRLRHYFTLRRWNLRPSGLIVMYYLQLLYIRVVVPACVRYFCCAHIPRPAPYSPK